MRKTILYYNFKYLIKSIFSFNFRNFFETIKRINKVSKKKKAILILDIIWCRLIHLTDIFEYEVFQMYNLNYEQRKTIFTTIHKWSYAKKFNNPEYRDIFNYKDKFYEKFSDFIGRKWLCIDKNSKEDLIMFIKNKDFIIGKNVWGGGGKQVYLINLKDYKTIDSLFKYLNENNINLIEDFIVQHSKLNELYPNSVNTIRLVTFYKDNKINIIAAYLRIGKNKYVDNIRSGGILVKIDIKSGITNTVGADYNGNIFEFHPKTKKKLIGFKLPLWKESIEMVIKAANKYKEVGIVGWDVAITEKGPLLIEGNYYPSSTLYQLPVHISNKKGKLPEFRKLSEI